MAAKNKNTNKEKDINTELKTSASENNINKNNKQTQKNDVKEKKDEKREQEILEKKIESEKKDKLPKETKEEQIVFKNNKKTQNKSSKEKNTNNKISNNNVKKEVNNSTKKDEKNKVEPNKEVALVVNNINTEEFFEEKNKKKRKYIFILACVTTILMTFLIFSTIFAMIHSIKPTMARGISIRNIDISNLTYYEAKEKLEEAFNVCLSPNIKLIYKDYSYIVKSKDIDLSYSIKNALDEAYGIGRDSNIIKSNYEIIYTSIFNKNIDVKFEYNEEDLNQIINDISTSIPGLVKQYSYYIEGDNLIITPGVDGIQVETDKLKEKIVNDIENRDPIKISKKFSNSEIEIPYKDVKADNIDVDKIYNEIHTEPKNAYYTEQTETEAFKIYPDVDGINFAITVDEARNVVSQEGLSEYIIPINRIKADITINDIGIEAFPHLISHFETSYDASNYSRSENLRIAASKINGKVLMPGEQFSFNGIVGERTVAEGYRDAKIYADGQVVDGLAGGICQISSTLYNAVLSANLQIDERYNHSFSTSYVEVGRDATVVYGVKDLKFTNTRTYPVKIEASVSNGVASFKIYGIKEENECSVKIIPIITATIPYTVQTITDSSLAPGATVVQQAGASGYKVTTYKEVTQNGVVISKDAISNDVYKTMTRIIRVGPQAPASTPVSTPEPTPEPTSTPEPVPEQTQNPEVIQ